MAQMKRCTLVDPNSSDIYAFRLNPETAEVDSPFRVNIVHTADGYYCDAFGHAAKTIVVSGTTGRGGEDEYDKLRSLVSAWQTRVQGGENVLPMEFHNWDSDEHYKVVARSLRKRRSATQPLIVRYELTLAVLGVVFQSMVAVFPALPKLKSLTLE